MEKNSTEKQMNYQINNDIYEAYGEKWYTSHDDPIALLRAEAKTKNPWVIAKIHENIKTTSEQMRILDVGCGGGFLSNALALEGFQVTGVDLSEDCLRVAKAHDATQTVHYQQADGYHLPFPDSSFDVVTAMDFLEHVEDPKAIIREVSRVLRQRGLFVFHTFNRSLLSGLVVIKMVEWLVKNSPKNMHILRLFIKPDELRRYCAGNDLLVREMIGIKPVFHSIPLKNLMTGVVPESMRFETTPSLRLSYMGYAMKYAPNYMSKS